MMMATQLLIDTDVLIDYLRDYSEAVSYMEARQEHLLVSVVVVAELYAGVREGEERARLERFLGSLVIRVVCILLIYKQIVRLVGRLIIQIPK